MQSSWASLRLRSLRKTTIEQVWEASETDQLSVSSGLTLMTGFWYTRKEIPLRQCIWYSALGWGGIVGSYMASQWQHISIRRMFSDLDSAVVGITRISPTAAGPEKWQYIFYIVSIHIPDSAIKLLLIGNVHASLAGRPWSSPS